MDVQIINHKEYLSGAMIGFADLQVGGLTIRSVKLFAKGEKVWFAMPSERIQGKDGAEDKWRDVVQASEAFMYHLQALARPQIRQLLEAGGDPAQKPSGRGEQHDRAYQESRSAAKAGDDIPF